MNFTLSGTNLDLILLIIFALSIFVGLKNGLVDSVIRFILTVLVFFGAWYASTPIAFFITLPELAIEAEILTFIEPMLQKAIAFLIAFIALSIAKTIIYILIKPIIKKIVEFFKVVDIANRLLGALFNVAKSVIITSLFLACLSLPIIKNGPQVLDESKGAKIVMFLAPSISEEILKFGEDIVTFNEIDTWANQEFNAKSMIHILNTMNKCKVLNESNLNYFYVNYTNKINMIPSANVTKKEYDELQEMLHALPGNQELKDVLNYKIIY